MVVVCSVELCIIVWLLRCVPKSALSVSFGSGWVRVWFCRVVVGFSLVVFV